MKISKMLRMKRNNLMKMFVCLMLLIPSFMQAEIGFEYIKGLDDAVTDKRFSPVHGYIAYYGGVLENIRLYGNYGQLIPVENFLAPEAYPKMERAQVEKMNAQAQAWRHPSFQPAPNNADDQAKQESKLWEYPYDAISALVQWLFPSPAGTALVVNTRKDDPLGDMAKEQGLLRYADMLKAIKNFQDEASFKAQIITILSASSTVDRNDLDAVAFHAGMKFKLTSQPELQKMFVGVEAITQEKVDKVIQALDQELQSEITKKAKNIKTEQKRLLEESKKYALQNTQNFVAGVIKKQREKYVAYATTFADILYQALVLDGTFAQEESKGTGDDALLYPQGIALHTLLAYVWVVGQNKQQLIEVYQQAGLAIDDHAELQKIAQEAYPANDSEYKVLKAKALANITGMTYEQLAYVGVAFQLYEYEYPKLLQYTSVPVAGTKKTYADCNEAAYRNLFLWLTFDPIKRKFDGHKLLPFGSSAKMSAIHDFLVTYPTEKDQARNDIEIPACVAWSNIMMYLNGSTQEQGGQYTIEQINDMRYDHGFYELVYTPLGVATVVNLFAKLTGNSDLAKPWNVSGASFEKIVVSSTFQEQLKVKLDLLCNLFTQVLQPKEGKRVDWLCNGTKNITDILGPLEFTVGDVVVAKIVAQSNGHIEFEFIKKIEEDWRINKIQGSYDQNLKALYYAKDKENYMLYDNPFFMHDDSFPHYWIKLWQAKLSGNVLVDVAITRLELRMAYKKIGLVRNDVNTKSACANMLKKICDIGQKCVGYNNCEIRNNSWWYCPLLISFILYIDIPMVCFPLNHEAFRYFKQYHIGQNNLNFIYGVQTILAKMCEKKYDYDDFLYVLSLKPDVNFELGYYYKPLAMYWLEPDDVRRMKKLIEAGADVNKYIGLVGSRNFDLTPLKYFLKKSSAMVECLLDAGANPEGILSDERIAEYKKRRDARDRDVYERNRGFKQLVLADLALLPKKSGKIRIASQDLERLLLLRQGFLATKDTINMYKKTLVEQISAAPDRYEFTDLGFFERWLPV